jgi:hypothetical protein
MPSYALIKYRPPLPPSLCTWREGGTESTGGVGRQEPPVRSRMLTAGNCGQILLFCALLAER